MILGSAERRTRAYFGEFMHILSDKKSAIAMALPGVLVMVFAIVAPILLSVSYSFTEWSGFGSRTFIGLDNYRKVLFDDPTFWRSLGNAGILLLVTVLIQNPIAFLLAGVLIRLSEKWSRLLRTVYFVPAILTVVVATKLWVNLLNPNYGLANKIIGAIGLTSLAETSWLGNPNTALGAVIFIIVWHGFGWALLFYYSGLTTVPRELEEAAIVDGASRGQIYARVVIPYMLPVIQAVMIIGITSCLKQMEIILLSTEGGPADLTEFVAHYLYRQAFVASRFGYGNAISVVFVVFALIVTLLAQRFLSTLNRRQEA